jgi:hypothetical protein
MKRDIKEQRCNTMVCGRMSDYRYTYQKGYVFPQDEKELALISISLGNLTRNDKKSSAYPVQELSDELQYFLSIAG